MPGCHVKRLLGYDSPIPLVYLARNNYESYGAIVGYKSLLDINGSDTMPSSGLYTSYPMLIFTGEDHKLTNGTLQSVEVCLRNETKAFEETFLTLFILQNTSTHYIVEAMFSITMNSTADHSPYK